MGNKKRKITLHEQLMKTAIGLSLSFLVMYVIYHLTSDRALTVVKDG